MLQVILVVVVVVIAIGGGEGEGKGRGKLLGRKEERKRQIRRSGIGDRTDKGMN